jgi:hypothetical protein
MKDFILVSANDWLQSRELLTMKYAMNNTSAAELKYIEGTPYFYHGIESL